MLQCRRFGDGAVSSGDMSGNLRFKDTVTGDGTVCDDVSAGSTGNGNSGNTGGWNKCPGTSASNLVNGSSTVTK
jgi:hypothetical protein